MERLQRRTKTKVHMATPISSKGFEIPSSFSCPLTILRCREKQKPPQTVFLELLGYYSGLCNAATRTCYVGEKEIDLEKG